MALRIIKSIMYRPGPPGPPGNLPGTYYTASQVDTLLTDKADLTALDALLPKADVLNEPDMATGATDKPPSQASVVEYVTDGIEDKVSAEDILEDGIAIAITAQHRTRTFLEANDEDGGPTDHARSLLGVEMKADDDYLAAIVDANNALTDIAIRRSDGQFADFVIRRLADRLAPLIGGGIGINPHDRYIRGDEVLPVHADMTTLAIWGSSSAERIAPYLTSTFTPSGITVHNEGLGGESTPATSARLGSIPNELVFPDDEIPASGSAVVTVPTMGSLTIMKTYTGTVAGVHGTLEYDDDVDDFIFTRTDAGSAVVLDGPTPMIPDNGHALRDAITLLWMGKNDLNLGNPASLVITNTDTSFDWMAPLHVRTLVLGHFVNTDTPEVADVRDRIYAVNADHARRYGDLFIDVHGLLVSPEVWTITGITPTSDDLNAQAIGNKPPSLSLDNGHLNAAGYGAVTGLIVERMTDLGWIA